MKILHINNLAGEMVETEVTWRPTANKSLLDKSNQKFLRTIQLTEQGLFIIKGREVAGYSLKELLKLIVAQCPTLTWVPEVKVTLSNGVAGVTVNSETSYSTTWQVMGVGCWTDTIDTGDTYTPSGSLPYTYRAKVVNATGEGYSNSLSFTPDITYTIT